MARLIRFPGTMSVPSGWPKFIKALAADNFNRSTGSALGATPVGGFPWVSNTDEPRLANGRMVASGVNSSADPVRIMLPVSDYEVEATLYSVGANASTMAGGMVCRFSNPANYWWLSTRMSGSQMGVQFWSNINGVVSAQGEGSTIKVSAGDKIKVRCIGTALGGYVNNVKVASVSDATALQTAKGVGFLLHASGTASQWDDLRVVEL
jgi:hypothetical protein